MLFCYELQLSDLLLKLECVGIEGHRVSPEGKWTGGIKDLLMHFPVDAAWELASDWTNGQRWWPGNPKVELREGENRKPGCLRYVAGVRNLPGVWCHERLVAIDNENHFFLYRVEENEIYGGLRGYIARAQVISNLSRLSSLI